MDNVKKNVASTNLHELQKRKFDAKEARAVADALVENLKQDCWQIEIAGSLRRRRAEVSDIEIVFVPRYVESEDDNTQLFSEPKEYNMAEIAIQALLADGRIRKRLNVKGRESWGMMNKLAVHVKSGIPVDFFTTNRENFFNYLVCRTGPAESNIAICNAAIARGWKWNPYGFGFSAPPIHEGQQRVHICTNERDVFEFVGLAYREPWERDISGAVGTEVTR